MNKRAFTLIEVALVLTLLSILVALSITTLGTNQDAVKYEQTRALMEALRIAIIGDNSTNAQGQRVNFGYAGDRGSLPATLSNLTTAQAPAWAFDATYMMGAGWKGSYMPSTFSAIDVTEDAWGNAFVWTPGASPATLVSRGSDGAAGGTGYATDITLQIPTIAWQGTVNGRVLNGSEIVGDATVELRRPVNGAVTATTTTTNATTGTFSFANVPYGTRALRVTATQALGPKQFTIDSPQYVIPDSLMNYNTIVNDKLILYDAVAANGYSFPGLGCTLMTWFDLTQYHNDGPLTNFGACAGSTGWQGTGVPAAPYRLVFNGVNSDVTPGTPYSVGPQQGWTFHMWVNLSSWALGGIADGNGTYIIDRTTGTNNLACLKMVNSGGARSAFQIRYNSGAGLGGPIGGPVVAGTWYFITAVRDYAALRFRIYVNDALINSTVDTGADLDPPNFKLGNHCCFAGGDLPGSIAYFTFYGRALSQPEIRTDCLATVARFAGGTCV